MVQLICATSKNNCTTGKLFITSKYMVVISYYSRLHRNLVLYAHAAYGFSSADENHVLESVDFGTLDKEDAEIDADADAKELEVGTSTTLLIHENTRAGTIQIAHHRHGHVHRKFIVGNGGYSIILIQCYCCHHHSHHSHPYQMTRKMIYNYIDPAWASAKCHYYHSLRRFHDGLVQPQL